MRDVSDEQFIIAAETAFQDAATDPELWPEAIERISRYAGAVGTNVVNIAARGPLLMPTGQVAEFADRYVSEGWHINDPRYRGEPLLRSRGIVVDQDIVSADEMSHLPYYTEWLRPLKFGWFAGLKVVSGDDIWCLTLHRSFEKGAFDQAEQARLLRLSSIVSRGATLANRLDFARLDGAIDASEALNCACLFVNRFGRVVRLNSKAQAMAGREFQIRDGRIGFPGASAKPLYKHIDATIWPDSPVDSPAFLPVVVRQPGKQPLVFQAFRLRGRACSFFSSAAAMVTITDLAQPSIAPGSATLRAAFGLSEAEARLARTLLQEFGLVEAARTLGLSHETLRSQLKSMLAKTGTKNQAELIALIGRLSR